MIELKKQFRKMNETFTQVYKDDKVVVYHTTFPSVEVFKYRIHQPTCFVNEEYEMYPSDEKFGEWAWCAASKDQFSRIMENHFADHPLKSKIYRVVTPYFER